VPAAQNRGAAVRRHPLHNNGFNVPSEYYQRGDRPRDLLKRPKEAGDSSRGLVAGQFPSVNLNFFSINLTWKAVQ